LELREAKQARLTDEATLSSEAALAVSRHNDMRLLLLWVSSATMMEM